MQGTGAKAVAAILASGCLAVACGGTPEASAGDDDAAVSGAGRTRTGSDSGTEADAAARDLVDLLAAYDSAVNELAARPELAADTESSAVQDLQAVFTEGNALTGNMLAGWTTQADSGLTIRPYGEEHGAYTSVLVEPVTVESEDEVSFTFCSEERYRVHQGGVVVDVVPYEVFEGHGTAVRDDGAWLLDVVELTGDSGSCETEEDQ